MTLSNSSIAKAYAEAKADNASARARDIANNIGVSEAALVAARVGDEITRLKCETTEFAEMMEALVAVGPVMTLTRNEACVHETTGPIREINIFGKMGQTVGKEPGEIELRMFFSHWKIGFAMSEQVKSGLRHSFQIFDMHGDSVIKIYAVDGTDMQAWANISQRFARQDNPKEEFTPKPTTDLPADADVDAQELRRRWANVEHSHEFHKIMREMKIGREQAMRLMAGQFAEQLDVRALQPLLERAAEGEVPLMCFVGSKGCVQIYIGGVKRIVPMGPWLNVLDPAFNLHLRLDKVASAWLVTKPAKLTGTITSIEMFDDTGEMICQLFGNRGAGETERSDWRNMAHDCLKFEPQAA